MCLNMLKHTHSCRQTLLYSVVELESSERNSLICLELDAACPTKKVQNENRQDSVKIQRYMVSTNKIKCGTEREISFFTSR